MKKVIVVVVVSLLVSQVAYGQNWWTYNTMDALLYPTPTVLGLGIGTSNPQTMLHIKGNHVSQIGLLKLEGNNHAYMTLNAAAGYDAGIHFWEGSNRKWHMSYENLDSRLRFTNVTLGEEVMTLSNGGYVGIGTNTPDYKLDVGGQIQSGCDNPYIRLYDNDTQEEYHSQYVIGRDGYLLVQAYNGSNWLSTMKLQPNTQYFPGNLGIGTTSPGSYKLNINGNTFSNGTITFPTVTDGGTESITALSFPQTGDGVEFISQQLENDISQFIIKLRDNTTNDAFKIWFDDYRGESYDRYPLEVRGDRVLLAQDGGNVGIGTDQPQSELAVNGTITAREVIVTTEGWPDFVFADNYKLMSLDKLERHIKVNKSLPGIPKEKEVLGGGVNIGDMQTKLLEKVEELTLYVINQEKELKELKKENFELRKTNENLENRISALEN